MKTDVIVITNEENQIEKALKLAEKTAVYKDLSKKDALTLRLLTEEMMSMVRAIAGTMEGKYWIEDEDNNFMLNLEVEGNLDFQQREQLVAASTSGKNEAAKGVMGKIRAFFEAEQEYPFYLGSTLDYADGFDAGLNWSLDLYREQIMKSLEEKREGAAEAWDELEKSLVSKLADEVKVSVRGRKIKLVIYKKIA